MRPRTGLDPSTCPGCCPAAHPKVRASRHHATVRRPEVGSAVAIGFKVRPLTVEQNHLAGTLAEALRALGGVVLVINRDDKLAQAASLYRRRFDGKAGQFGSQRSAAQAQASAATRHAAEFGAGAAAGGGSGPDGAGGNPWAAVAGGGASGGGGDASVIPVHEMGKMLEHRETQVCADRVALARRSRRALRGLALAACHSPRV